MTEPSIEDSEYGAIEHLQNEYRLHLELCSEIYNLIGHAFAGLGTMPLANLPRSRRVALSLLIRLLNDLRCIAILAARGYALQAAATVSCLLEVAYCIVAIGSDNELATKWIGHADLGRSFMGVKKLMRLALGKMGQPATDDQVERLYFTYQQLCLAKHANPALQKEVGFRTSEGNIIGEAGPDLSEAALCAGTYALEHAAALALMALTSFIQCHLPALSQGDFVTKTDPLWSRYGEARKRSSERWPAGDPFEQGPSPA